MHHSGRHFLHIPGPTNIPDRVLRAIDRPTIDHRGPEFTALALEVLEGLKGLLHTVSPIALYPASGTGAWEASLVNTCSPGDRVLFCETGHFASVWASVAARIGLDTAVVASDWRRSIDLAELEARLVEDRERRIRCVCIVHNETSTGVVTQVQAVRAAIDRAQHPALLIVDTISSLGCMDYRMDEWGVDVTIGASQKGLMLPPGFSFTAVSEKALAAHRSARSPRFYWDWADALKPNRTGAFPYTPPTNLLFGLREALAIFAEDELECVFRRHARYAEAVRRAVRSWGLETWCADSEAHSPSITAVRMPVGHDADALRAMILGAFDMSLGAGLGKAAGKLFRIGHLGSLNDLMLLGALAGVEMGLRLASVPHSAGGLQAALDHLSTCTVVPLKRAAIT